MEFPEFRWERADVNFPKVLNFREVFNKPMYFWCEKIEGVEVRGNSRSSVEFLLSTYKRQQMFTTRCSGFCQDSEYFMIFYHPDYLSHKMEIYAIRILGCWEQAFLKKWGEVSPTYN